MSIASMTGFARENGCLPLSGENISWVWEIKSVNGKSLDVKMRLPAGYDELMFALKAKAAEYLTRGSVSVFLELAQEGNNKKIKIDDALLEELTAKALSLCEKYGDKIARPSAAELLGQRGVVETEENELSDDDLQKLKSALTESFAKACAGLQADRRKEGEKIKSALKDILANIEKVTIQIEQIAETLPLKLKEKLAAQLQQYGAEVNVSEERMAQEIVLLVTRADIREEIDRLKTHIKSAYNLLDKDEAVGRRLDFLCQELNREANTTCSKAADIAITNLGMELKALIEQFREQVQNIE